MVINWGLYSTTEQRKPKPEVVGEGRGDEEMVASIWGSDVAGFHTPPKEKNKFLTYMEK